MKRAQAPWNAAWNIPSPRDLLIEAKARQRCGHRGKKCRGEADRRGTRQKRWWARSSAKTRTGPRAAGASGNRVLLVEGGDGLGANDLAASSVHGGKWHIGIDHA
jgi:hypothetical protein